MSLITNKHIEKFKDNKYIANLENKLVGKNHDEQLEIIYNAIAKDLTCVSKKCENSKLHPHSIINPLVLDYAHWIHYTLLKLKFIFQEKTLANMNEEQLDINISKGKYSHQLLIIENLEDTIKSITGWGGFYEGQKRGTSIDLIAIINLVFLPLSVIVGWFGMNFQSMGAPTLKNNGIFGIKYGQTFIFGLFIFFTVITLNFLIHNYDLHGTFMYNWQ